MDKPAHTTNRDASKFNVRFPDGLRDQLAEAAQKNNRSMNAELVRRIEASFEAEGKSQERLDLTIQNEQVANAQAGIFKFTAHLARLILETNPGVLLRFTKSERERIFRVLSHCVHYEMVSADDVYTILDIATRLTQSDTATADDHDQAQITFREIKNDELP